MKKIILAILLFFTGIYFLLNAYFSDVGIYKYPDLAAVKEDKAIEKGWVPALLPSTAYDIEETHDIDTNQLFGRFYYKEQDEKALLSQLTPIPESNGTYVWEEFLFKVDTDNNRVKYRNKP